MKSNCSSTDSTPRSQSYLTSIISESRYSITSSSLHVLYFSFDFCKADEASSPTENLGQVVFGERIRPSSYKIQFLENKACEILCTKSYKKDDTDKQKQIALLRKGMFMNYQHHWIVDNMPVTWCYPVENGQASIIFKFKQF